VLARRLAGPRWALASWLVTICWLAESRSANPAAFALLAALAALVVATGTGGRTPRALWAGVLTAVAAAFRLDFAIYTFVALAVALLIAAPGVRRRALGAYAAAAGGLTVLVYLPFAIAIGPADLYEALVGHSLKTGSYWSLPFPLSYDRQFRLGHLPHDLKDLLDFYSPALLVAGLAVAVAAFALPALRERRLPDVLPAALAVFGVGGLSYLLSRTDVFHTAPLLVVVAVLLAAVAARRGALGIVAAVVLAALALHGVANRLSALGRPPALSAVHVAVADGAKAPPAEARALERVVAEVQRRVPPGRPISVAPRRADLVRFNAPLVYVLTERENPTHEDFGLQTDARSQASIVAALVKARPGAIVRWTDPISSEREPNKRGQPSGVHTLDAWIAAHYRVSERLYHYDVLVPR
jgi:hypothetical protein